MQGILEFGIEELQPIPRLFGKVASPKLWVKFDTTKASTMDGRAYVLGRKCDSLSELKVLVEQLKSELDVIYQEAQSHIQKSVQ